MKELIKKIVIIGLFPVLLLGCEGVLQLEEPTAVDGEKVFNDPSLAVLYLNYLYGNTLPGWSATANVGMSDESIGRNGFIDGQLENPNLDNPDNTFGNYSEDTYAKIRNINVFITEVEAGDMDQSIKDSFIGQALFLRVWVHWDLVLSYGGVPMITTVLNPNQGVESAKLPRVSAQQCVDILIEDLDRAIDLIGTYGDSDYGRVTKSAVSALKGRILLFFASPMFDPNGISSADGIPARWEAAYQANLKAKQIAESEGHALYTNFDSIFIDEDNEEAILIRKYTSGILSHGFENSVRPRSVNNSGIPSATPSWDLAESFPMKSGLAISEPTSNYDEAVYWADRDPRFYATIGYNSIPWKFKGRDDERQWTYVDNEQEQGVEPLTGFYLKKHINVDITNTQTTDTPTDWIEIRFAEVLLNLAESANEAGQQQVAYENLYAIRERAGIDAGSGSYGIPTGLSKTELREVIMNERKIELAFENKRFWDIKRRNLYANSLAGVSDGGFNGTRREVIVTTLNTDFIINSNSGIAAAGNPADSAFKYFEAELINTVDWNNPANYADYFTTTVEEGETLDINFLQPEYNFNYIPLNALGVNPNLEQTIYWTDENGEPGTFDPLVN